MNLLSVRRILKCLFSNPFLEEEEEAAKRLVTLDWTYEGYYGWADHFVAKGHKMSCSYDWGGNVVCVNGIYFSGAARNRLVKFCIRKRVEHRNEKLRRLGLNDKHW